MGSLKTLLLAGIPAIGVSFGALAEDRLVHDFAICAGRLSAQVEHQWLMRHPSIEDTERTRDALVDLLDAVITSDTSPEALALRINAKHAHAMLLKRSTFNPEADDAATHACEGAVLELVHGPRGLVEAPFLVGTEVPEDLHQAFVVHGGGLAVRVHHGVVPGGHHAIAVIPFGRHVGLGALEHEKHLAFAVQCLDQRVAPGQVKAQRIAGFQLPQLPQVGADHGGGADESSQRRTVGAEDHRHVPGEVDGAESVGVPAEPVVT